MRQDSWLRGSSMAVSVAVSVVEALASQLSLCLRAPDLVPSAGLAWCACLSGERTGGLSKLCFLFLLLFGHSVVSDSLRPHGLQHARLSPFTISWSLLKLMSIESVIPSNHLILGRPLLLLPSSFPSIRVFSDESAFYF